MEPVLRGEEMPPYRRVEDLQPDDSIMTKVGKSKLTGDVVRLIMAVSLGGGAGYFTNEHKTADDAVQAERLTKIRQEFDDFKAGQYQYHEKDREERDERVREFTAKIAALEAEVRMLRRERNR